MLGRTRAHTVAETLKDVVAVNGWYRNLLGVGSQATC